MKARYTIRVYQQNWLTNRTIVEVVASDAAEAKLKALQLAGHIHSPLTTILTATEVQEAQP